MKLLYKGINQIKDVDTKQGLVTVYASQFNTVDSDGDIMMPGCFSRTIKSWGPEAKNRIWKLFNHNSDKPICKPVEIKEDAYGLLCTAKMPDTTFAKDVLLMYENGDITEHSIGFSTVKSEDDREYVYSNSNGVSVTGVNRILEVKLYEYSPVLWGANENTPLVGIKSEFTLEDGNETVKQIIKSLRNWKGSEEGYELLEIKLTKWQSFMQEQIALAKSNPLTEALTVSNPQPKEDEAKAAEFLTLLETKLFNMKISERLNKAV